MREVVFDTETTGKRHQDGHRIVEIAAIELEGGKPTGRTFHRLINPERDIPDEVVRIHGITNDKVANEPTFKQIIPELIEFLRGSRTVAHNSEFDEQFVNAELKRAEHPESFWAIVSDTVDTIDMSRRIWIGGQFKHNLDVVLDRCGIDRTKRTLHGALIDSELLAEAYSFMKAKIAAQGPTLEEDLPRGPIARLPAVLAGQLAAVAVSDEAQAEHAAVMSKIRPTPAPSAPKMG